MEDEARPPDGEGDVARSSGEMPPWVRRAIALFFTWVLGLLLGYWLVTRLRTLLLIMVSALFVSFAIEPAVNALARRGWRRGAATGFVMLVLGAGAAVFFFAVGSIMVQEAANFLDDAPSYLRDVESFAKRELGVDLGVQKLINDLKSGQGPVRDLANELARDAVTLTTTFLSVVFQALTIAVLSFYLTADGPRLRRTICSVLPPDRQRRVLDTWELAIDKTGGYLYSRGIQALASAIFTAILLTVVGVPYAVALSLFVGVVSQFVPTIGTYLAMVLPVLIALVNNSAGTALVVLAVLVGYQQFENYVLGPRITARTMNVHPALAISTVLVGAALVGPIGAILALPATAVISAVASAAVQRYEVVPDHLTRDVPERRRRERGRLSRR